MISISYFSDFVDTLIDCLENDDEDRFLMFAATTMDRELKKYLYDEGFINGTCFPLLQQRQPRITIQISDRLGDFSKSYLLALLAASAKYKTAQA